MSITEIFLISIGLGMDAFAVSICKGLSIQKINWNISSINANGRISISKKFK